MRFGSCTLLFLILLGGSLRAAQPENRAAKLYQWYERGEWFELPTQFMADGSAVPKIDSGWLVEDPKREPLDQLYIGQLEFQAEVISRCGVSAVDPSLEKLRSGDPYIAIVAALALDKLLGVELGYSVARGEVSAGDLAKSYRERADLCYPKRKEESAPPVPETGSQR